MTNKKKSGLGRGLDSLIPILPEEDESNENSSLTLEDMLKEKEKEDKNNKKTKEKNNKNVTKSKKVANKLKKTKKPSKKIETEDPEPASNMEKTDILESEEGSDFKNMEIEEIETTSDLEKNHNEKPQTGIDSEKTDIHGSRSTDQVEKIDSKEFDTEKSSEKPFNTTKSIIEENEVQNHLESPLKTEKTDLTMSKIKQDSNSENAKVSSEEVQVVTDEKVDEPVNVSQTEDLILEEGEKTVEDIRNNLTEREKQSIEDVIKIIGKNPRITLWSAKSAAVFRYLRKTEPEFSISKEASKLIDEAVQTKYPEIWELFKDIEK